MPIHVTKIGQFDQQELDQLTDNELSMLGAITEHGAKSAHRAAYQKHVGAVLAAASEAWQALKVTNADG